MANPTYMNTVGVRLPAGTVERLEHVARTAAEQLGVPIPIPPSTLARELLLRELRRVEQQLGINSGVEDDGGEGTG